MIIPNIGTYIDDGDKPYEVETTYYLHFHIKSALVSIEYIINSKAENTACFENEVQYYHYYTDHLLYSMGQISERFRVVANPKSQDKDYNERRKANRSNYNFTDSTFPILSDKAFRNTVEHIDEHNISLIASQGGVGGFNIIDEKTPKVLKDTLLSNRHNHIYTLDLLSKSIYITRNGVNLTLSIDDIKKELLKLDDNVNYLATFISI